MSHHHPYHCPRHTCAVLALSLGALRAACDRNGRAVAQQVDATTIAATERSAQTWTSDPRKASHTGARIQAAGKPLPSAVTGRARVRSACRSACNRSLAAHGLRSTTRSVASAAAWL